MAKNKIDDHILQSYIDTHREFVEAFHRYYTEFEYFVLNQNYNSSKRLQYWLNQLTKLIIIRQEQTKHFKENREPVFDSELYRIAYHKYINQENDKIIKELDEKLEQVRTELNYTNPLRRSAGERYLRKKGYVPVRDDND